MNKIVMMSLSGLKSHESVSQKRLKVIISKIRADGVFRNPVVVENQELIILDGHHRVAALKKLGAKKIPAYLVDYHSPDIRIYLRRKNLLSGLIKECVIRTVLMGRVFPPKTTRHVFSDKPKRVSISLEKLR